MAKVKMNKGDGDSNAAECPPKATTTQGDLSTRLTQGFNKDSVDLDACPADFVPMVCNKNTRVGTLTGRAYLFPADVAIYVHKGDENNCAKHGAKVLDAKAISAIEEAKKDAAELAAFRKESATKKPVTK